MAGEKETIRVQLNYPLERVNEKIHEMTALVAEHLQAFLATYGIHLNTVKVLVMPRDERMKALISLKAFGLSEDTRTAGMRQLRDLQLVDVRRRSVSHDAFDFRRMRNTYVLDKARFAKRPDE